MNLERRIRRVEERFVPPESVQLRALSEIAAEGTDLDAGLIAHEADQVLARMRAAGPRSLEEVAEAEGIPADELVRLTRTLRQQWEATG